MTLYILITIYLMINCYIAGSEDLNLRRSSGDWLRLLVWIIFGTPYYVIGFLFYFLGLVYREILTHSKMAFLFKVYVLGKYKDPEKFDFPKMARNLREINAMPKKYRRQRYRIWALNRLFKMHNYEPDTYIKLMKECTLEDVGNVSEFDLVEDYRGYRGMVKDVNAEYKYDKKGKDWICGEATITLTNGQECIFKFDNK